MGNGKCQSAIDQIILDQIHPQIHLDQVDNAESKRFTFFSNGVDDVKITLVWDDPSSVPPFSGSSDPVLTNNLDLQVINPDNQSFQPFILNPDNPNQIATHGMDDLNNVEMIKSPAKQGIWEVVVVGTNVPEGPQEFTLIVPNELACIPITNTSEDYCIPYAISEGGIHNVNATIENTSIIINFNTSDTSNLQLFTSPSIINGTHTVLVNGESSSDPTSGTTFDEHSVTVMIESGENSIEIIGTQVIPEFGTVVMVVLIIAMIFVIVYSTNSRLGMISKF